MFNIIVNLLYRFKKKINSTELFLAIGKKYDLIIIDDLFPHPASGFRNAEFLYYLKNIPNSIVICSGTSLKVLKEEQGIDYYIKQFTKEYPYLANRIKKKKIINFINSKLYYCIFWNQTKKVLFPIASSKNIAFAYTLYPGGGFEVYNKNTLIELSKITNHNLCKYVIVNQNFTLKNIKDYVHKSKIRLIEGSPILKIPDYKNKTINNKINIVFAAGKYCNDGKDKGFDIFLSIVDYFKNSSKCAFHLIGGFNDNDIGALSKYINTLGYINNNELDHFFQKMDIIVSPNRPFVLCNGCFDGFPLATVAQAGLNGVCMICTDELKENNTLINNRDIIILPPRADLFINTISELIMNPDQIVSIGYNGRLKLLDMFSEEKQLKPRLNLIREIINSN